MVYWIKRKYRQIERTLSFLPLIWKGYDWDYHYAIDLFQHQLKRTEKNIRKNGIHVGNQNTASRIKTAVDLMEKVYNDEYSTEHYDLLHEKYGKNEFIFEETGDLDKKGEPYYSVRIEWENARDGKHNEEIEEISRKMMKESLKKQKRAHKLLWDFIEHNIQKWWD
jgi:hypothetical protein